MKRMDERLRRAILKMDASEMSFDDMCSIAITDAAQLISAISDRASTPGLQGHQKNYHICRTIAQMRIRLEQIRLIFATDNIDTFDRSMMKNLEKTVRARRSTRIPPRNQWPKCFDCGGLVHPRKSQDSFVNDGARVYRCHKCCD